MISKRDFSKLNAVNTNLISVSSNLSSVSSSLVDSRLYIANMTLNNLIAKKNYVKDSGQLIEGFQAVSDFTIANATGAENTSLYKNGTKSLELSWSAGNTSMTCDKTVELDLSDLQTFSIWVNTDDPSGFSNYLTIFLSHDNWANYYQFSRPAATILKSGEWHLFTISRDEFTVGAGNPSWSNTFTKIRITIKSATGKTPKLYLGGMYKNMMGVPRVLFCFDDAHASIYRGFDYIVNQNGKPMTYNCATDYVDTDTNLTLEQVRTMYDSGLVDVANHTSSHEDLTTLSAKQARDSIMNGKKALDDWGFTRASDHFVYPLGKYNDTILGILKSYNIKTARVVGNMMPQYVPVDDLHRLRCVQIINNTTVNDAIAHADAAMRYGQTVIYLFHQLSDTYNGSNSSVYEITKFRAIVDHCISIGIPFTTISKWYWGLQNDLISA